MSTLNQTPLMVDDQFLSEFKGKTEAYWQRVTINPNIYSFQFQRGTRWNSGLADAEIEAYESTLGVKFPKDFRFMLRVINGTDLPTINVYGSSGEPHRTSLGVYSYPRDLSVVRELRQGLNNNREEIAAVLLEQGVALEDGADLVPIYGHRYIVCSSDLNQSVVLSIEGTDAILFGDSLRAYLQMEFLGT
jgi:hypothetical protein